MHPMITVAAFTIAKIRKQPVPTEGWMGKDTHTHTHTHTHTRTVEYDPALQRGESCRLQQHGWT